VKRKIATINAVDTAMFAGAASKTASARMCVDEVGGAFGPSYSNNPVVEETI
jgi:hypothetical protein